MHVPLIWAWRVLLGGFAVAYLLSATLQTWVPPLLPFIAAAAVEAQFFLSGARRRPRREVGDPGPQPRDLADFGWTDEEELEPRPARVRSKVRRRLVQLAFVLVMLSGLFLIDRSRPTWQKLPTHTRTATLATMTWEATRIAGHPAQVICDTKARHVGYVQDADGLAEVGGRRMWVTPDVCYRLAKVPSMTGPTESSTGRAIAVLAHEAWHLHGVRIESIANCNAYRSGIAVGRAFGLSASTARRLMREQLADNPAAFAGTAYVVPHGCRLP
jgi:hypothetical protein